MSTKEPRAIFENRLQLHLKNTFADFSWLKVNKNMLVATFGDAEGNINFQYLNKSNGYTLSMFVESPEIKNYITSIQPIYRSNLIVDYVYCMTSSGESSKDFSRDYGGTLRLPKNENDVESACLWIESRMRSIFLPRMINILELRKELIDDAVKHPEYFAYPFLTIMKVIIKHQLQPTPQQMELFLSKRISRNKNFDGELIKNYQESN